MVVQRLAVCRIKCKGTNYWVECIRQLTKIKGSSAVLLVARQYRVDGAVKEGRNKGRKNHLKIARGKLRPGTFATENLIFFICPLMVVGMSVQFIKEFSR